MGRGSRADLLTEGGLEHLLHACQLKVGRGCGLPRLVDELLEVFSTARRAIDGRNVGEWDFRHIPGDHVRGPTCQTRSSDPILWPPGALRVHVPEGGLLRVLRHRRAQARERSHNVYDRRTSHRQIAEVPDYTRHNPVVELQTDEGTTRETSNALHTSSTAPTWYCVAEQSSKEERTLCELQPQARQVE